MLADTSLRTKTLKTHVAFEPIADRQDG